MKKVHCATKTTTFAQTINDTIRNLLRNLFLGKERLIRKTKKKQYQKLLLGKSTIEFPRNLVHSKSFRKEETRRIYIIGNQKHQQKLVKNYLKDAVRRANIKNFYRKQVQQTRVINYKEIPTITKMQYKRITGRKSLKDVTKQHFGKQILQWMEKKQELATKKSIWSGKWRV